MLFFWGVEGRNTLSESSVYELNLHTVFSEVCVLHKPSFIYYICEKEDC